MAACEASLDEGSKDEDAIESEEEEEPSQAWRNKEFAWRSPGNASWYANGKPENGGWTQGVEIFF